MSDTDYAKAVAEFMSKKGVTRCPTACVVADPRQRHRGRPRRAAQLRRGPRSGPAGEELRNHQQMLASLALAARRSRCRTTPQRPSIARLAALLEGADPLGGIGAVAHRGEFGRRSGPPARPDLSARPASLTNRFIVASASGARSTIFPAERHRLLDFRAVSNDPVGQPDLIGALGARSARRAASSPSRSCAGCAPPARRSCRR